MSELDDFLGEPGRRCLTCNLPAEIRGVIAENEQRPRASRHSRRKVVEWVASKGFTTTTDSIYKHVTFSHE